MRTTLQVDAGHAPHERRHRVLRDRVRRRDRQRCPRLRQAPGLVCRGQQPIVADALEAGRQHVLHGAADELGAVDARGLLAATVATHAQPHGVVAHSNDAFVADRGAVRVARISSLLLLLGLFGCSTLADLGIADFDPPYLTTFTKQGDIIDEAELFVGQCGGADCGWTCSETIKIDEQYKIVSVDTVTTFDCDSVKGNLKKSVFYKSGYVNDKGIITMTPEIVIQGIKSVDE